jgi:hypothetical protein
VKSSKIDEYKKMKFQYQMNSIPEGVEISNFSYESTTSSKNKFALIVGGEALFVIAFLIDFWV